MGAERKQGGCRVCGRPLHDPVSVERQMGPVCWAKSNGGVFDNDLKADDKEWERREKWLRAGGEIDLGCNWRFIDLEAARAGDTLRLQLPQTCRISVGFSKERNEFTVIRAVVGFAEEIVFSSPNLRAVYKQAVSEGPQTNADAARYERMVRRALKRRR